MLYSKGPGKNTNHAAVNTVNNMASISYVGIQVFQQTHRHMFASVPNATTIFNTSQFQLMPSTSVLY